jgi:DNA-binding transcriptional ArsR family regulator
MTNKERANSKRRAHAPAPEREWRLFTSQGLVLLTLGGSTDCTISQIAAITGLGRSTVLSALADLREADMVEIRREGRRNYYEINKSALFRHPSLKERKIGDLLGVFFNDTGNK